MYGKQNKKRSDISTLLNDLRAYFPNIYPYQDGGVYYTKVKLSFTDHFHDLNINISYWMKSEGHGIYEYPLQVEKYVK